MSIALKCAQRSMLRWRDIAVPSAKIAYIELGTSDSERRIGFGAG